MAAPAGQPELWLLGVLSFCLRGGVLVLCLPIIVLPTQVEVRLALGANLGSSGLTPGFWGLVGVGTAVTSLIALFVLYGLARIEAGSFDRLVGSAEVDDLAQETSPGALVAARHGRRGLIGSLFVIQALTLIAVLVAAVPLAASVGQATLDEILRPSSNGTIYARVLGQVGVALTVFVAALPVIDMTSAMATRRLLLGLSLAAAIGGVVAEVLRAPVRAVGSALVAWLGLVALLLAVGWALSVAWQAARASFLATTSVADLFGDVAPFIVALMLAGVFVAGLALAGFVSAFRAALWTLAELRR